MEAVFQLEEGEILVEPAPSFDERNALLFYESAEGGAGALAQLVGWNDGLMQVARRALEIMHYDPASFGAAKDDPSRLSETGEPECVAGCWVPCRPGFFLPVRVLSRLFRRLFLDALHAAFEAGGLGFFGALAGLADPEAFISRLRELRRLEWVVYAKPPFGGPEQVFAYLGRYTHRVAIANSRLVGVTDDEVAFRWKDYRHHGKTKVMTLDADEFIRRFLLHTLPDGFHRIRHYGFLANGHRAAKLALCRKLLDAPPPQPAAEQARDTVPAHPPDRCPCCNGTMIILTILPRPEPCRPSFWQDSS